MSLLTGVSNKCRLLVNCLQSPLKIGERLYAKTILGTLTGKGKIMGAAFEKKKRLPVETDPAKLVNYCCGANIYKEGEDPQLKEDSEYPDWLWTLRLGPPPPIEEWEPNTKEYWEHYFFLQKLRRFRLMRTANKKKLRVNEQDKIFKLKKIRFRALAYKYDPGFDEPPMWDKKGWRII